MARHRIVPAVDRSFAFQEAAGALAYLDTAHGFGKVVIQIAV